MRENNSSKYNQGLSLEQGKQTKISGILSLIIHNSVSASLLGDGKILHVLSVSQNPGHQNLSPG